MTDNSNKKEKKKFSFSDLIYNDKYLVVLSIFLAFIVWIGSSLSVGADDTKTIKITAPIELSGKLSGIGMQYYALQNSVDLSITLSGQKYVIGQVTADDLNITFDTSAVNRTGNQSIPIRVTNKSKRLDYTVESVYPSSIEGYFDVNTTKTFDVGLKYDTDKVADGYVFGTPVLSEDKIIVSGPKTYVDKIDNAYCEVDFGDKTKLTEPFTQDCDIKLDGDGVETSYITITSRTDTNTPLTSLSVTIPVLETVTLPVTSTFEDRPARLDRDVVSVSLTVGSQEFDFDVTNLNGVSVLDGTKKITAKVTVSNSYSEHKVRIIKDDIIIEGAQKGEKLAVSSIDSKTVTVLAPKNANINSSNLTLKCDVSKKTENNQYPIEFTVSNPKAWVYGKYTATIE